MPGDASRLKALQKRAREGVLTPALVLHVTGLQVYLVLDGHLRLLAGAPALEVCRLEGHQEPTPLNLDALAEAQARLRAQGRLNAATEQAWQHSVVGLSVPKPISGPSHARWCWDVGTWDAEVRQREAALLEPLPALWDGLLDPDEAL